MTELDRITALIRSAITLPDLPPKTPPPAPTPIQPELPPEPIFKRKPRAPKPGGKHVAEQFELPLS